MPSCPGDEVARRAALDEIENACLEDRVSEATLADASGLDQPGLALAARARYLRANVQFRLDRDDEAIVGFREAEPLAEAEDDERTRAMAVVRQCEWATFHDRWDDAEARIEEAVARAEATGESHLRARAAQAAAELAVTRRRWDDAAHQYRSAAALYTEAHRVEEATKCVARSRKLRYLALFDQRSLEFAEHQAAERGELDVFTDALLWAGDDQFSSPGRAIVFFEKVLNLATARPDQLVEARLKRGVCRERQGDLDAAMEDYLSVAWDAGADDAGRAQGWANLLSGKLGRGDSFTPEEENALFDDGLFRAVPHPMTLSYARAVHHVKRGNLEAALVALDSCAGGRGIHFQAAVAQLHAHVLSMLGRRGDALDVLQRVCGALPDDAGFIGVVLAFRMGCLLHSLGLYSDARDLFIGASADLQELAPGSGLHRMSRVFALRASWAGDACEDQVRDELDVLLEELGEGGPPMALGSALQLRAALNESPEDARRAGQAFLTAQLPVDAADAFDDAAILLARMGRVGEAVDASRTATGLIDEALALAPDDENRVGLLARTRYARARLVEALFATSPKDALREAIRAKSGALTTLLSRRVATGGDPHVRRAVATAVAPAAQKALAIAADSAAVRAASPFVTPLPQLEETRALYRALTRRDRVARGLDAEQHASVDAIIGSVPADGALLELFVAAEWIYTFIVARGTVRVERVPLTDVLSEALDTVIVQLRPGTRPGRKHERLLRGALRRLHAGLIGDLSSSLTGVERLWISPGARLVGVPWPALLAEDGTALVDRFETTMLLSGAQLALPRSVSAGTQLALVRGVDGARPLAAADVEVDTVARAFDATGWAVDCRGPDSSRDAIEEAILGSSVFHFCGHAGFDEAEGMAAQLASPERPLVAAEILGLDLRRMRLAVLSGCETGRAEEGTGDEVVGLLRAFFAAGCQGVLASRWLADDASTAALMLATYDHWFSGKRMAAALRDAQRNLRDAAPDGGAHPFFWANFAFYGVE